MKRVKCIKNFYKSTYGDKILFEDGKEYYQLTDFVSDGLKFVCIKSPHMLGKGIVEFALVEKTDTYLLFKDYFVSI